MTFDDACPVAMTVSVACALPDTLKAKQIDGQIKEFLCAAQKFLHCTERSQDTAPPLGH
jgi:hypothetical protein